MLSFYETILVEYREDLLVIQKQILGGAAMTELQRRELYGQMKAYEKAIDTAVDTYDRIYNNKRTLKGGSE